jgi:hypothetical protein
MPESLRLLLVQSAIDDPAEFERIFKELVD